MAEGHSFNRSVFRPVSTSTGRRPDSTSRGLTEFIRDNATRSNLVVTRSMLANTTTLAEGEEMESESRTAESGAVAAPATPHVPRDQWRDIMSARRGGGTAEEPEDGGHGA